MNRFQVILIGYLLANLALFTACSDKGERKIKLTDEAAATNTRIQSAASVLQVAPAEQQNIAILPFQNQTEDASLDWLSRGLADMLATELSQSRYINVIPLNKLYESANEIGQNSEDLQKPQVAFITSKKAQAETIITGSFYYQDGHLFIDAEIKEVATQNTLKRESVSGPNLERIFAMVDELSNRVRTGLRGDLVAVKDQRLKLHEMTSSLEAFKCFSKAREYEDKFMQMEADTCLRKAIELDTTFASAYLMLAQRTAQYGQSEAAIKLLLPARKYINKLSQSEQISLRLLEARLEGDIEKLVAAMQDLLRFEPRDVDTRLQLANHLMRYRNYDRALEQYETILELAPKRKLIYNQLGYLYAWRGDFKNALRYLNKYEKLAPNEPNPYDSKGEILLMAGRFNDAIQQFKTSLSKRPNYSNSLAQLSEVYAELDNEKHALKYIEEWMRQDASDRWQAGGFLRKAKLLWRFEKFKQAEKNIQKALKINPGSVYTVLTAGEFYHSIGDSTKARKVFRYYLTRLKNSVKNKELTLEEFKAFLIFALQADLPATEYFPFVEKLSARETRTLQKQNYDLLLGILYLRLGNYEQARTYCQSQNETLLKLLTQLPAASRSQSWKYSVEAIRLAYENDAQDLPYYKKLLATSQNAGRKDLEVMSRFLLAQFQNKYHRTTELMSEYQTLGAPLEKQWRIIGPFKNRGGFDHRFPPEESLDPKASYHEGDRTLTWLVAQDGVYDGFVDLKAALEKSSWSVGYGVILIESPEKRIVQIRLATDESCKLWLNRQLVWKVYRTEDVPVDNDIVTVVLHPGKNKLLIKVGNSLQDWGFYLRVTDENGNGFPDIKFLPVTDDEDTFATLPDARIGE